MDSAAAEFDREEKVEVTRTKKNQKVANDINNTSAEDIKQAAEWQLRKRRNQAMKENDVQLYDHVKYEQMHTDDMAPTDDMFDHSNYVRPLSNTTTLHLEPRLLDSKLLAVLALCPLQRLAVCFAAQA